jgi:hypothetical protein
MSRHTLRFEARRRALRGKKERLPFQGSRRNKAREARTLFENLIADHLVAKDSPITFAAGTALIKKND